MPAASKLTRRDRIWEKLELEIETARRMRERNINPLDTLDMLLHGMIELLTIGYKQEHPESTDSEIRDFIRQQLAIYSKKGQNRKSYKRNNVKN